MPQSNTDLSAELTQHQTRENVYCDKKLATEAALNSSPTQISTVRNKMMEDSGSKQGTIDEYGVPLANQQQINTIYKSKNGSLRSESELQS